MTITTTKLTRIATLAIVGFGVALFRACVVARWAAQREVDTRSGMGPRDACLDPIGFR